jgi:general secretion pathway protein B
MSFILDALKKSEIERQRQSVPGLMDTSFRPRRRRLPLWAAALCVLLGVNLVVLTYVLMRRSTPALASPPAGLGSRPADAAPAPTPAADPGPPAADAGPPAPQHFSPLDSAPEYAPEIPVAPLAGSEPAPPPAARAEVAHHSDPLLTNSAPDAESDQVLPTISEISLSGAQALPELHLDVHVYATNPAERFVYINMRKYHEGAKLQEGPTVERIRRDGVVLNYQGLRFLLPRQP